MVFDKTDRLLMESAVVEAALAGSAFGVCLVFMMDLIFDFNEFVCMYIRIAGVKLSFFLKKV